jgi:hypothetical protein
MLLEVPESVIFLETFPFVKRHRDKDNDIAEENNGIYL